MLLFTIMGYVDSMGGNLKKPTSTRKRKASPGRPLLTDVAKAAGVSIATASRALSGADGVSDQQRERIRAIADELHYEHDPIGRSLRSGKTHLIGVWVESIRNNSSARLVTALTDMLHKHGYDILVTEYSDDPTEDASRIRSLARRRPDYMVVLHPTRPDAFRGLVERGIDVVMISGIAPADWDGPLVRVDSAPSRQELAAHLCELGHRKAMVLQPARRIGRPGSNVMKRVVERAKLPLDVTVTPFSADEVGGGLTTADIVELIRAEDGPTFLHVNEAQAPALLKGIAEAGLRIPRDVSVMSTGAPSWAEVATPPLSVTDVDYYLCGVRAAEVILELSRGEQPKRRIVRGTYIRRESVGPAPRPKASRAAAASAAKARSVRSR